MPLPLGGPGQGLPIAQGLFPSELFNAAQDISTNRLALAPGDVFYVPPGTWWISNGAVSFLQYLDPITLTWSGDVAVRGQPCYVKSDGQNVRIANLTGCPLGAVITNGGTGFTQATASITPNVGGSTWQPIVGGALSVTSIAAGGANYTMPPLVAIPSPQPGLGAPATAYATLTGGSVTGVTLSNVGAGYTPAQTSLVLLLPNPSDPNAGSISTASVVMGIDPAKQGKITAAFCINPGASLASVTALTLTASGGAGAGATLAPQILQSVQSVTVTGAGTGITAANQITAVTAVPPASAIGNPSYEVARFRPRLPIYSAAVTGGSITSSSAVDSGLFVGTPTALFLGAVTTQPTIAFVTGGVPDIVVLQPAN